MKKIYKHIIFKFLAAIFFLTTTIACYKKDFDAIKLANATPEYLYPLLDVNLSLKDIVDPNKKQLNITEGIDGFYTFIYYQDVIEKFITDFLKIEDVPFNQSVALSNSEIITLPISGSVSHDFSQSIVLNSTNGEKLKTIVVKSGSIPLVISSTFEHDIDIQITFPYIKKNGLPLTELVQLKYLGITPIIYTTSYNLAGYTIDCSENDTKVNTVSYTGKLVVNYKAGKSLNASQKIDIKTGLSSIAYSFVKGYIGAYDFSIPQDTVAIDIFDNAYLGRVYFTDPKVRAIITNSIGAPSSITLNKLITQSNITGQTEITGSTINTVIPIFYPSLSEVGQTKSTTVQLDKDNSNVQTVFNPAPSKVIFKMSGSLNPDGEMDNFVTDLSSIKIRGEVEIPMEGRVSNLVLLDTLEGITYPDLAVSGNTVTIVSAGFNIALCNGFPMNANIQIYFLDNFNNSIDSLFSTPHFIPSGTIDNAGKVTVPTDIIIKEMFDQKRYEKITASTKAIVVAQFSTANNGSIPVKIYSSYKLKSNIGLDIKANVVF